MPRQAALLRGINLGSTNRVSMADLRELVAGLGYADVETLVQSGNVVYAANDPPNRAAARIERALAAATGLDIAVVGRGAKELARIVALNPLAGVADNPKTHHVAFLSARPEAAKVRAIDPDDYLPEAFRVHGREVYVWMPGGMQRAKLTNAFWERRLGVTATMRNWNTVAALAALTAG